VDINIAQLRTIDIQWADYVFISAMYIQKESVAKVIGECKNLNKKIVAGGPLFTQEYDNYPEIDHFILNEAEITLPFFLNDLSIGNPQKLYKTSEYADISLTPAPDYQLLDMRKYANMNLQVSRGCPYACDFCEITALLGHKVRMKSTGQVLEELEVLYSLNWRGPISIVDDNFIGNKKEIKNNLVPAISDWMQRHKYPFEFTTQATITLADDDELMSSMIAAGINSTFIGIETPDEISLESCNKLQNQNRDMLQSIKKMQNAGFQVSAGFIVGFDSDLPTVFQRQIDFIQQSGIVTAMVGLLNAPKNTGLYLRLEKENRLTIEASGNNTDSSMNFIPKMNYRELMEGYKKIIQDIYSSKPYYIRLRRLLLNYNRLYCRKTKINRTMISAFIKSFLIIGFLSRGRFEYWKLIIWTLYYRPGLFVEAITQAVYGYHFRAVYGIKS